MDLSNLPWYVKMFLGLGGASIVWKAVQGSIPKAVAWATPFAEKATDAALAFVLKYPPLRWLILGNKDNAKSIVDAVIEGARALLLVIENRFNADIDAQPTDKP